MNRLALTFSALALAGCTTYYEPPPRGAVTTTSGAPVVSAGSSVPPSAPVVAAAPAATATVTPAPAPSVPPPYRAGFGIIESVSLVTLPASAAAGGTLPPVTSGPYRLTVRMDDGSIQTMIIDSRTLLVGDRVQLMSDGRLLRQ
jgi:hypothetical protein